MTANSLKQKQNQSHSAIQRKHVCGRQPVGNLCKILSFIKSSKYVNKVGGL